MLRKRDENRISNFDKAAKTVSFDKVVLEAIEKRAKQEGTTFSKLVNAVCRTIFMTDKGFYTEMAKHYYLKMQESKFLAEQSEAMETALVGLPKR